MNVVGARTSAERRHLPTHRGTTAACGSSQTFSLLLQLSANWRNQQKRVFSSSQTHSASCSNILCGLDLFSLFSLSTSISSKEAPEDFSCLIKCAASFIPPRIFFLLSSYCESSDLINNLHFVSRQRQEWPPAPRHHRVHLQWKYICLYTFLETLKCFYCFFSTNTMLLLALIRGETRLTQRRVSAEKQNI